MLNFLGWTHYAILPQTILIHTNRFLTQSFCTHTSQLFRDQTLQILPFRVNFLYACSWGLYPNTSLSGHMLYLTLSVFIVYSVHWFLHQSLLLLIAFIPNWFSSLSSSIQGPVQRTLIAVPCCLRYIVIAYSFLTYFWKMLIELHA